MIEHNEISKHHTARVNVFLTSCPQDSAYQRLDDKTTDHKMKLRGTGPPKRRRKCRQSPVTVVKLFPLPLLLPFLLYFLNL